MGGELRVCFAVTKADEEVPDVKNSRWRRVVLRKPFQFPVRGGRPPPARQADWTVHSCVCIRLRWECHRAKISRLFFPAPSRLASSLLTGSTSSGLRASGPRRTILRTARESWPSSGLSRCESKRFPFAEFESAPAKASELQLRSRTFASPAAARHQAIHAIYATEAAARALRTETSREALPMQREVIMAAVKAARVAADSWKPYGDRATPGRPHPPIPTSPYLPMLQPASNAVARDLRLFFDTDIAEKQDAGLYVSALRETVNELERRLDLIPTVRADSRAKEAMSQLMPLLTRAHGKIWDLRRLAVRAEHRAVDWVVRCRCHPCQTKHSVSCDCAFFSVDPAHAVLHLRSHLTQLWMWELGAYAPPYMWATEGDFGPSNPPRYIPSGMYTKGVFDVYRSALPTLYRNPETYPDYLRAVELLFENSVDWEGRPLLTEVSCKPPSSPDCAAALQGGKVR